MKLTPEIRTLIDSAPTDGVTLEAALRWARLGWPVFPLRPGEKEPYKGSRGVLEATRDEEQIRRWWTDRPDSNIGGACTGRLVIDVDHDKGAETPRLPSTRTHGRAENRHYIYAAPEGSAAAMVRPRSNEFGPNLDSRAGSGSYIVLPPSLHEKGQRYEVLYDRPEHVITDEELRAIYDTGGARASAQVRGAQMGIRAASGGPREATGGAGGTPGARLLSQLLREPPAAGGRNDWLTAVAGHLAKQNRGKFDLYAALLETAAALLPEPLPPEEVAKVRDSIWRGDSERHAEEPADMSASTGWLSGNGRVLFHQIRVGSGDEVKLTQAPWGDFDIQLRGRSFDTNRRVTYQVELLRDGEAIGATVEAAVFGDERAMRRWLAGFGCTFDPSDQAYPKMNSGVRLQRYLDAQEAPNVRICDALGWDDEVGGFVHYNGVIRATGHLDRDEAGVIADERLRSGNLAPYHYGFADSPEVAREVLREVLTFQDPEVASVFGAWWAATLLKPQIGRHSSIFPFCAVEATSGSGKTSGFFALMVQLAGRTANGGTTTRAAFRDSLGGHRSGIVWTDDQDSIEGLVDVLRAATGEGTMTLKGVDRMANKQVPITAAVMLSGEALGLNSQKALIDRAVILNPPAATERESLRRPGQPQWDDVLELNRRYEGDLGLSVLSGWLQQQALVWADQVVQAVHGERSVGHGRHREKVAVLLAGARLLDALVGHREAWEAAGGEHYRQVRAWSDRMGAGLQHDNTLTRKLLPWALRAIQPRVVGHPNALQGGKFDGLVTPVFTQAVGEPTLDTPGGLEVWVNTSMLADCWRREVGPQNVIERVESLDAVRQQADQVCEPGTSRVVKIDGRGVRFRRLLPEYAAQVAARVEGD